MPKTDPTIRDVRAAAAATLQSSHAMIAALARLDSISPMMAAKTLLVLDDARAALDGIRNQIKALEPQFSRRREKWTNYP